MTLHKLKGDFSEIEKLYLKSLSIASKIDYKLSIARNQNLLAELYNDIGNKQKALEYYRKSAGMSEVFGCKNYAEEAKRNIKEIENNLKKK